MLLMMVGMASLFSPALNGVVPDTAGVVMFSGVAALMGLALIPLFLLFHGGAIHLANEALSGRPVRFGDGFAAARRRFGAIAGFETMFAGILFGIGLVFAVLFGVMIVSVLAASDVGSEEAIIGVIGMFCCLYAVMLTLGTALTLIIQGVEAVGARAAVLSGRTGSEAFKDAWQILRRQFKSLIVMGLIAMGIMWGYSAVSSVVLTPLQFMISPQMYSMDPMVMDDPSAFFGVFGFMYVIIMIASLVLNFPLAVYTYLMWTAFYRQLVRIAPAERAVPAPMVPPPMPQPPVVSAPPPAPSDFDVDATSPPSPGMGE